MAPMQRVCTVSSPRRPTVISTGFHTFTLRLAEGEWRIAKLLVGLDNAA